MAVVLTLGPIEFAQLEIPAAITFGGAQALAVHRLVGGARVVDAMGGDDASLEWQGIFTGSAALSRARALDGLRKDGRALDLTCSELSYRVVIASFRAEFQAEYRIPYSISCTVLADTGVAPAGFVVVGPDEALAADMETATELGAQIADPTTTGLLGALDTAIKGVSDFATATSAAITGVLQPLAAVQARVGVLIASTGNVLASVTTLGGILPNNPISRQAAALTAQATAMTNQPRLYQLQSVLGRMGGNLGALGRDGNTVTVAGGDLYRLAADSYGDATAWTGIARANGLTDPVLTGINTITVPPRADGADGVLNG